MLIQQALNEASKRLGAATDPQASIKSRILLQHVLATDVSGLIRRGNETISRDDLHLYRDLVERALFTPVYRIIGAREFHGLSLRLNDATLEPRDDTETLVDLVLDMLGTRRDDVIRFADLGTGTGAVALALLYELPTATAVATDLARNALEIADLNAESHGFAMRFKTTPGHMDSWTNCLQGTFNFIVTNPPYIKSDVVNELDAMVNMHDPRLALDGGEDGLCAYRDILDGAEKFLCPDGFLAMEIGFDQKRLVIELAQGQNWKLAGAGTDLGGHDRALCFVR